MPREFPASRLHGDGPIRSGGGKGACLDDKYFVSREAIANAFAGLPRIDYEKFREDLDAVADQDPTPGFWPGS